MVERLFGDGETERGMGSGHFALALFAMAGKGAGKGTRVRDLCPGNLPRLRRVWGWMPDDREPLAWGLGMGLEYCPAIPWAVQVPGTPTWAKWRKKFGFGIFWLCPPTA